MRLLVSLTVLSLAACSARVHAQGVVFGHPSLPSEQPTFRLKEFTHRVVLPSLQLRVFNAASERVAYAGSLNTCPMPVARGDSSGDSMPVAKGGTPEPMPVARSGCWNPLDPRP